MSIFQILIWFNMYFICLFGFFRDFLHVPSALIYMSDLITLLLFVVALFQRKKVKRTTLAVYLGIFAYFISTLISYNLNSYSYAFYLNGFRYKFLCYLFFIACTVLLNGNDIKYFYQFINNLFILNILAILFEYSQGYHGDFLSGTFGVIKGANGYMNLLLIITSSIYVIRYLQKEARLWQLVAVILSSMLIMAMVELKIYMFELAFIIIIAMAFQKFSWRQILLVGILLIGAAIGVTVMGMIFQGSGIDFFTSDAIWKYLGDSGYTGQGDLNRFNAVTKLYELFFKGNLKAGLFGFGLGNCHYGTPFLLSYTYLAYMWFADSFVYIESGAVGLFLFELIFLLIFFNVRKRAKIYGENSFASVLCNSVSIISLCAIICSIYDVSLLEKSSYMLYFICALPFVLTSNFIENNENRIGKKKEWKIRIKRKIRIKM